MPGFRRIAVVVAKIAVPMLLLASAGAWWTYRQFFPNVCQGLNRFSVTAWAELAHAKIGAPDRACLVEDLVARDLVRGRTRSELTVLLGVPLADARADTAVEWTYYLGPERGPFGIDSQLLVILFDSAGKVRGAIVRTD